MDKPLKPSRTMQHMNRSGFRLGGVKFSGRYLLGLYGGVGSVILSIILLFISTPRSVQVAQQKQQGQEQADLEIARIQAQTKLQQEQARQRAAYAQTLADNQVKEYDSITVMGYLDTPDAPPQLDARLFQDPTKKVMVYDTTGKCVGHHQNGRFYWKHDPSSTNACDP